MLQWLLKSTDRTPTPAGDEPLATRDEPRLPVHVLADDARLNIEDGQLRIEADAEQRLVRLDEISLLALHGGATATMPCLAALAQAGVPVVLHSRRGYYQGQIVDLSANHAATRRAQYGAAADPKMALELSRDLVCAKIQNAARQLRRRVGAKDPATRRLDRELASAARARTLDSLRGVEGAAAACWFGAWSQLLRRDDEMFVFGGRSRQPPRDAVNALISYLYAVLAGTSAAAALGAGLDPNVGFLHAERPGRPALALDLIEPLRTAVVDAAVIAAINNGEFDAGDFEMDGTGGIRLAASGRRAALGVLERRLSTVFVYDGAEMTWRAAVAHHALLLARHLRNGSARVPAPMPK